MPENEKPLMAPCALCHRSTKHSVAREYHQEPDEEYQCDIAYYILVCNGCGCPSFRYTFTDYESSYPISDREWEVPTTIETYPRVIENHVPLDGLHSVPKIVRAVYKETLHAMQEKSSVLAGLGMRATIEAICNQQKITGKNLDSRITKLASEGLISRGDAGRLHAIRFLGNDAAHEIKKASKEQLAIALRIVEHLIVSVYILDSQAKGHLDTVITEYGEFEELLHRHLTKFNVGDEFPLAKYLGTDVRRITGALSQLQTQLMTNIQSGEITWLSIGTVDKFAQSKDPLQHFIKT